ncbi:MAG: Na+:solute symporter [Candidatus Margulisbacteria bacterium]|nr:Na+:solute symporter [Candidatus Margulisiibacteriota bacterium]
MNKILSTLDWSIIIAYFIFAFSIALYVAKKSSESVGSYFTASRSLPWWMVGTSMVATTFAADTPLAIAGIVATQGIAGNWFWWSWALSTIAIVVFFSKRWFRSKIVTDAQFITIRYRGKEAQVLRSIKAVFYGVIINCFILGWVLRAMSKIASIFLHWNKILTPTTWLWLQTHWPKWLMYGTVNDSLSIVLILFFVMVYCSLGGIRSVILTDIFQFVLAMGSSILFSIIALKHVGGILPLIQGLSNSGFTKNLNFFPSFSGLFPFQLFCIWIFGTWWIQHFADGGGYVAQRISCSRSEKDASLGTLWFAIANFVFRSWPWIIVGLVILIYPFGTSSSALLATDPELGYPMLMRELLPSGLLGLVFASLLAAFMSTVDTHLNWGASYLINDLYQKLRPKAKTPELIWISRLSVIILAILAIIMSTHITSIAAAWKYVLALGAGLGFATLARWFWWRVNAYTEIAGMITALLSCLIIPWLIPSITSDYLMLYSAFISTIICLIVILYTTNNKKQKHLVSFIKQIKPLGFWGNYYSKKESAKAIQEFYSSLKTWLLGSLSIYGLLFGLGFIIFQNYFVGIINLLIGIFCLSKVLKSITN